MKLNRIILFIAAQFVASLLWMTASVNTHAQTNENADENSAAAAVPLPLPPVTDAAAEAPAPPEETPAQPSAPPSPTPVAQPAPPAHPVSTPASMPPAPPVATPAPPAQKPTFPIEFNNAPVSAVLEYYAKMTNRSIISAPNVLSVPPITFRSQTELTKEEAIQALDSVLAINGIGTVPMGEKFLKIVQIATAKQEGLPVGGSLPAGDTLVTQVLPLKYADVAEVAVALEPYKHGYGQIIQLAKSNSILISETGANISRMLEILKFVDQPSPLRVQTKVYILSHAKASEVVARLNDIVSQTAQLGARATAPGQPAPVPTPTPAGQPRRAPGAGAATAAVGEESVVEGKVIITSDERTNKIFLLSRPSNFDFFDRVIAELDAKVDPDVITKVVPLSYADAEDMAGRISALISGGATPTTTRRRATTTGTTTTGQGRSQVSIPPPPAGSLGAGGSAGAVEGFLQFAQGVRILPDPRTNSLLLMATKEDMARLMSLISDLDTPVSQVLVEAVIAEVDNSGTLDVGVDMVKRLFQNGQVIQTGSSGASPGTVPPVNLQNLTGQLLSGLVSNAAPLALAAGTGGLSYFATFKNLGLDAVLRLASTTSKVKILSTPIIMTLHNQEADILVGESRPFPSATVANVVASGSTAVSSSVEYKDIAIELKVTPRINPDGYVTMDIMQKINDVGEPVDIGGGTVVNAITKREATTSVAVKDGSTIVLGGLISETKGVAETKTPFLGDIPLLGTLFRSKNTSKIRKELLVFIRPTVLRNDAEAVAEARRRSRMLKANEELELDKQFRRDDSSADGAPAPLKSGKPQTKAQTPPDMKGTEPSPSKVKALQEDDAGQAADTAPAQGMN